MKPLLTARILLNWALGVLSLGLAHIASAQFTDSTTLGTGAPGTIVTNPPAGSGSFEVVAGGEDIWGASDEFTFHSYSFQGTQFDLRLRVESLEPNGSFTKAGLMVRESLTTTSRMAFVRVTPSGQTFNNGTGANDVRFAYRTGTASAAQGQHEDPTNGIPAPSFPNAWVRLERHGATIGAYSSTNGTAWLLLGNQDTSDWSGGPFAVNNYFIGLAQSRDPAGFNPTAKVQYRNFGPSGFTNLPPTISDAPDLVVPLGSPAVTVPYIIGDANNGANALSFFASSDNQSVLQDANLSVSGSGTNRTLQFTPSPNVLGTATVTVTALDPGGLRAMDRFTVTVAQANQPPTISLIPNQVANEDSIVGPIPFTVGDAETAAAALTLTSSSTNHTLLPTNNISFGGSESNRTVTLVPMTNQFGTTLVTLAVSDGQGATGQTSFIVTINAVNDLPSISPVPDQVSNEDTVIGPIPFTVADVETAAVNLTLTSSSTNTALLPTNNISFGGSGSNRTVTLTPLPDQSGHTLVTVAVSDGQGGTAQTAFRVEIKPVIDPPQIVSQTEGLLLDAGQTIVLNLLVAGDPPFDFQWFKDGAPIAGATNGTFTIPGARGTDSGIYGATVANPAGGTNTPPIGVEVREYDFGDAPPPYPTTRAAGGAMHRITGSIRLGDRVDGELDGQPSATAQGDDDQPVGLPSDEDGAVFATALRPGEVARLDVRAGSKGYLSVWIDFNQNGSWDDPGERVLAAQLLNAGLNAGLELSVPATALAGVTFARLRFSSEPVLAPGGMASDGEVEDYQVAIEPPVPPARCDLTCQGTNFWLTFPGNYAPDPEQPPILTLCLEGPAGASGRIDVPGLGLSIPFTIPPSLNVVVSIPSAAELGSLNDAIASKGIHVTARPEVGVLALNRVAFTGDGYRGLPVETLGTEYLVQAFRNVQATMPEVNGTQFAIVGTEDTTTVTITPKTRVGHRLAGRPFSITLGTGDVYQLRNTNDATADLSGTLIVADKPIAVFGGHPCANVRSSDVFFCNHVVEQLLPIPRWGTRFVALPFATRHQGDLVQVLASADATTVSLNGSPVRMLARGETYAFILEVAKEVTADQPVLVTQFATSSDVDGVTQADPTMVTVPPVHLFSDQQVICTGPVEYPANYVNIVAPADAAGGVLLDGTSVTLTPIEGTTFWGTQQPVSHGRHLISSVRPIGVTVYGWSEYDAYAWPGCFHFGDITPPELVCPTNLVIVTNLFGVCTSTVPDLRPLVAARDNCTSNQGLVIAQSPAPGTGVPTGDTLVRLTATDAAGNSTHCDATLRAIDSSPIQITCPDTIRTNCLAAGAAVSVAFRVTAHTACQSNLAVFCQPPSGSSFGAGVAPVTCSTTNEMTGEFASCQFAVIVECLNVQIRQTAGQFVVSWEGPYVLQEAPDPAGPWTPVPNAQSPHAIQPVGSQRFFRLTR